MSFQHSSKPEGLRICICVIISKGMTIPITPSLETLLLEHWIYSGTGLTSRGWHIPACTVYFLVPNTEWIPDWEYGVVHRVPCPGTIFPMQSHQRPKYQNPLRIHADWAAPVRTISRAVAAKTRKVVTRNLTGAYSLCVTGCLMTYSELAYNCLDSPKSVILTMLSLKTRMLRAARSPCTIWDESAQIKKLCSSLQWKLDETNAQWTPKIHTL